MSDEGIDCHIVKVCEHLALRLLQAFITSHLSLQAAARQSFVFSPVYFLYLCIISSISSYFFTSCLRIHFLCSLLSFDLCPMTQLHYTAQAAKSPPTHTPLTTVPL